MEVEPCSARLFRIVSAPGIFGACLLRRERLTERTRPERNPSQQPERHIIYIRRGNSRNLSAIYRKNEWEIKRGVREVRLCRRNNVATPTLAGSIQIVKTRSGFPVAQASACVVLIFPGAEVKTTQASQVAEKVPLVVIPNKVRNLSVR
jgi:hypothetical protein